MALTSEALADRVSGETVPSGFLATVRRRPDAVALRWRDGDAWREWTWTDYAERAARLAGGLAGLGVGRGDRVVLMMRNRPEFHVADMAVLLLGATPISIYNSSSPDQIAYLAGHCHARVAVLEDGGFVTRMLEARSRLPQLEQIVVIEPDDRTGDLVAWDDVLASEPVDLERACAVAQPADLATVIYTSGTTGPPKGVMLDHLNVRWTVESLRLSLDIPTDGRRVVSYLPMAHVAERMVSHYQAAVLGYEVSTCPEPNLVAQYLPDVRPEVFFAVPRVWEKIHAGVIAMASADPERKTKLDAAVAVGLKVADCRARAAAVPPDLVALHERAEAEGLALVRNLLGLDRVVAAISGAAPIPVDVLDFFRGLGVPISEIYGMSESSGPMTWAPYAVKAGSVGPAIPGEEVRLGEDGEVLCRGGNVFRGYLDDPEKTAEALDDDGWLHSGDIGVLDDDGYLRIVDRKKELIITAGGKNISPANIEGALRSQPLIGQACAVGDGRPFVAALLVLDPDVAPMWAKEHGIEATSLAELADHPEVQAEIGREVDAANARFSNVERVKEFRILHEEWLPDSAELTPTMKLKRRGILGKYALDIESIYAG